MNINVGASVAFGTSNGLQDILTFCFALLIRFEKLLHISTVIHYSSSESVLSFLLNLEYHETNCAISSPPPMLSGSGVVSISGDSSPLVLNVSASYNKCTNQIHITSSINPQATQWSFGDVALTGASVDLLFGDVRFH